MKDILKSWRAVFPKIKRSRRILLLSDFDGTLCPIVSHPALVKIDKDILESLSRLNKTKNVILGFVSGRPVLDLKEQIGLKNAYYIGNHGLELKAPKSPKIEVFAKDKAAKFRRALKDITADLKKKTARLKGVWLEDKKYSLSLHYRRADTTDAQAAAEIFKATVNSGVNAGLVRVTRGKKVFEIRPAHSRNKGTAVLKVKKKYHKNQPLLIYLGDDITDEDVFGLLSKNDIGIHIGKGGKTKALYNLKNVKAVADFLRRVYLARSGN